MSELKNKILVVDDDPRLRTLLTRYLAEQDFSVVAVADGEAMDRLLLREQIDLVVLDLMLPGEPGVSICQRLRADPKTSALPVIMLTALGDDNARIRGLESGADDYVCKPFNPRELVARIQAVLRRASQPVQTVAENQISFSFGDCVFDLATRALTRSGETQVLTSTEFAILKLLVSNPNQSQSRQKLTALTRAREHGAFDRAIDMHISRLRRMIEEDAAKPRYIQTVWGLGYVFVPDSQV